MGIRILIIILFFAVTSYASKCINCHDIHYADKGACITCHRGNEKTSRKNIAHSGLIYGVYADFTFADVTAGEKLAKQSACRRCHSLNEGNNLAPDLSAKAAEKTGRELDKSIKEPTDFMPDFKFSDVQRVELVKYLLTQSKLSDSKHAPYTVFINKGTENSFEKNCGGCHRALTLKKGPLGEGDAAPNLSGIFTKYYNPIRLKRGEIWTDEMFRKWINNPREIFKQSYMPPQRLKEKEVKEIIKILRD